MEFEPMLTPREKSPLRKISPEEDRTRDAVDSEPKHYQLSYSGPPPFELCKHEETNKIPDTTDTNWKMLLILAKTKDGNKQKAWCASQDS